MYRWPRFSYNSATSTLKIYTTTSFLHETTISFLYQHLTVLFNEVFPPPLLGRIQMYTNLKINGFAEEYQNSDKVPDLGIFVKSNNNTRNELKWALEVGFSEQYNDLREDIQLWLVGQPTCSMAVLINITESPKYRCPLDFDLDLCDQLNIPQDPSQITEGDFSLQGEYGPVMFKECQWVGQISVTMEIWIRHPRTGLPRRRGGQMSIIPPNSSPQLRLGDFLFDNNPEMTSFDWGEFRTRIKDCLQSQAASRCRQWLHTSKKLAE